MDDQTKLKGISLEDLQIAIQEVFNIGFGNVGTCTTAADTAAKTVTLGTIFSLSSGCTMLVKFTNGITSENSTLAVTHTTLAGTQTTEAAKPIYLKNAALEPDVIEEGAIVILRYNGTQFDIIGGAGESAKNAVLVGDYSGSATYPSFDAFLDTVHTKQQSLTDAKKQTARSNIGAAAEPEFDDWYEEVTDTTGKNPAHEGWYELDDDEYVLTEDNTPQAGKTYYEKEDYEVMTI